MRKFILLSFMFVFSLGAFCSSAEPDDEIREEMRSDSIKKIVSEIDLPVIYINIVDSVEPTYTKISHPEGCVGESITDNEYVMGSMIIMKGTTVVYESGEYEKKKSGMRLKVRGNTSSDFPYKSYKIKTEKKTDLLNRGEKKYESKSWVLLNIYSSRDLRTVAGRYVAKQMGMEWEPEHQFVNLILNGEYRGLYMLSESIQSSEGRCKLEDESGLLIECDPYWWKEILKEPVIKTEHLPYAMGYTFKHPEPIEGDTLLVELGSYLNAFEDSLYNNKDVTQYIDLESFATWILTHDLIGTSDGVGSNIYLTKDSFFDGEERYDSKLKMGPLWDFDSLFETPGEWCTCHDLNFFYYQELFKRPEFLNVYKKLWEEVRDDITENTISYIKDYIEEYGEAIDQSRRVSPPDSWVWRKTINDNLKEIEDWFYDRVPWMDMMIYDMVPTTAMQIEKQYVLDYVTIYTTDGNLYRRIKGNTANYKLPSGIYIIQETYSDGSKITKKYVR